MTSGHGGLTYVPSLTTAHLYNLTTPPSICPSHQDNTGWATGIGRFR